MGTLLSILVYNNFNKELSELDSKILDKMRICSFNLNCPNFEIDFSENKFTTYKLYKTSQLDSYFPILKSQQNLLHISLSKDKYEIKITYIKDTHIKEFVLALIGISLFSILFSLYTLYPLRQSLLLTQEFIKDILHDFNTPLGALRLNSSMLKREIGENKKITRMEGSIENILSLQENLKCYLFDHEMQQEQFNLKRFIEVSVHTIENSFPSIHYEIDIDSSVNIKSNEKAFSRIISNLVSNASKYNRVNGSVRISYKDNQLYISDTGKGIKDTKKIFNRFYKEQERGIGVGLHIVQKLCKELKIEIEVESTLKVGTTFTLIFPSSS